MAKLDRLNRIYIPAKLIKESRVDFSKDVYYFLTTLNTVFLDNHSHFHKYTANLGKAYIDINGKLYVPKKVREMIKIDQNSNLTLFCHNYIFIKKRVVPKNHL